MDVKNFNLLDGGFVPQENGVTMKVEISDDGLTWSEVETLILPAKHFQVEYETKLTKDFIRFKADKRTSALLYLKEE